MEKTKSAVHRTAVPLAQFTKAHGAQPTAEPMYLQIANIVKAHIRTACGAGTRMSVSEQPDCMSIALYGRPYMVVIKVYEKPANTPLP